MRVEVTDEMIEAAALVLEASGMLDDDNIIPRSANRITVKQMLWVALRKAPRTAVAATLDPRLAKSWLEGDWQSVHAP